MLLVLFTMYPNAIEAEKITINCTYEPYNSSQKLMVKVQDLNLIAGPSNACKSARKSALTNFTDCVPESELTFQGTPQQKANVVKLWFQNSNIRIVPSNIFQEFPNLQFLRIWTFNESVIEKSVFENLSPLKELCLGNYATVSPGAFANLTELEVLDLTNNKFEKLPQNIFQNNKKLRKLVLAQNNLINFNGSVLRNLPELVEFDLSENVDANISMNTFENSTKLRKLNLYHIGLREIEDDLLIHLVHLESIDISHNFLIDLPANLFEKNSKLRDIDLSGNQIEFLNSTVFANLKSLEELKLNSNSLTKLEPEQFNGTVNLSYLDVRFNNLTDLDKGAFFESLPNLKGLYATESGAFALQGLPLSLVLLVASLIAVYF